MHWILQENLFKENEWENLVLTLERFSIPFSVHKVIPFIGELVPVPEPKQEKVICFGSYSMRHSVKKFGWTPGVYDLMDQTFIKQKEYWGDRMLNSDSRICKFKDLYIDDLSFIRPIDDSKYFAGKLFEKDDIDNWRQSVCVLGDQFGTGLEADTLVQVCEPKEIYSEYRYWIANGQIITKSLYKRGRKVIYSGEVDNRFNDYVLECINIWKPAKAFVIDVCDTPEGIKIVEINTINSAGFYAADVQSLVLALEDMEC